MDSIQVVYQSEFCQVFEMRTPRGSAKLRRMNKRKLKRWLVRHLENVWEGAKIPLDNSSSAV